MYDFLRLSLYQRWKDYTQRPSVIVGLATFIATLFLPEWINDPDIYSHVIAGQWMIAHHAVPLVDPFSWTMPGHPWVAHEWLSEILFALAYKIAGWSGVVIISTIAFALVAFLLIEPVERAFSTTGFLLIVVCGILPVAPNLLARPHILALPCLIAWFNGMLSARRNHTAPPFSYLLVMILWANLHGSFILGIVLAGLFGAEATIESAGARLQAAKKWAVFCAASILVALINPNGIGGLIFPIYLMHMKTLSAIVEWGHSTIEDGQFVGLLAIVAIYLFVFRKLRLRWVRLLLLAGLIWNAYWHVRNQIILGLLGTILVSEAMTMRLETDQLHDGPQRSAVRFVFPTVVLAALLAMAIRICLPIGQLSANVTPEKAVDSVPQALRDGPVFNDYGFGGYLMFRHIRPFIDGRMDMYGDPFMEQYLKLNEGGAPFAAYLAQSGIQWVLIHPDGQEAKTLQRMQGWKSVYADKFSVVYVRQ